MWLLVTCTSFLLSLLVSVFVARFIGVFVAPSSQGAQNTATTGALPPDCTRPPSAVTWTQQPCACHERSLAGQIRQHTANTLLLHCHTTMGIMCRARMQSTQAQGFPRPSPFIFPGRHRCRGGALLGPERTGAPPPAQRPAHARSCGAA